MKVRNSFLAALVVALLVGGGYRFAAAQQSGGAFIPSFAYSGISGFPRLFYCGTGATCGNTASGMTAHIVTGVRTLTAGTAVVSGISPPFTSTATASCVGNDTSGSSGVLTEVVVSGVSSITINGTGAGTVAWMCAGY